MNILKSLMAILLPAAMIPAAGLAQNALVTYPAPRGAQLQKDFTVKVRVPGQQWQTVDTYPVKVDQTTGTKHSVQTASVASFDFKGEVEVAVTPTKGSLSESRIRPLSYNIDSRKEGNTLTFRLDRPRNLSVEINGDVYHNLHLFANPIDANKPSKKKGKGLIYFAAGVHNLPGDTLAIPSGTTVYVEGGAIVNASLIVRNAHDVKIGGRGIVRPEGRGAGVVINCSRNVSVDGIITTQLPTGGSDNVRITNVKAISSYNWGDGMNVFASSNVSYDGVFCRNSDDCSTVYATRLGYFGSCHNIKMENSTLWADVAHPIFIGLHGNSKQPDTIDGVLYRNIDILNQSENQLDYQGCLAINAGDNNSVRNVRFEDIRIESIRKGMLVNLRVCYNKKYCTAPGLAIDNITFKNVSYNGAEPNLSLITGYDETRKITNVKFEGLKINGKVISDDMPERPKWYKTSDLARIFVGEHVEGVTFTK